MTKGLLLLLSPAKKMHTDATRYAIDELSQPAHAEQALAIAGAMATMTPSMLAQRLKISAALAECNFARYQHFLQPIHSAYRAAQLFAGDAYQSLSFSTLPPDAQQSAQQRLRILSGLYGILSPHDGILPYRLDMGTRWMPRENTWLVDYWRPIITKTIVAQMAQQQQNELLILSSQEYSAAVDFSQLPNSTTVTHVQFQRADQRPLGMMTKRLRGQLCRHILINQINTSDELRQYCPDGMAYNASLSRPDQITFVVAC